MDYFKRVRVERFPDVKDFSSGMDHLRFAPSRDLSFMDWFWFKPVAHYIVNLGLWLNAFLTFFIGGLFSISYEYFLVGGFLVVLSLLFFLTFVKKWFSRRSWRMLSFYDVYVRDYPDEDSGDGVLL